MGTWTGQEHQVLTIRLPKPGTCPTCHTAGSIEKGRCRFCGTHTHRPGRDCPVASCRHYEPTRAERREQERAQAEDEAREALDEHLATVAPAE